MAIAFNPSPTPVWNAVSTTAVISVSPPAGNSMIVVLAWTEQNSATITITNSGGALTWTSRASNAAGSGATRIWTAPYGGGGGFTITATRAASDDIGIAAYIYTGVNQTNPVGATSSQTSASLTTWNPSLYNSTTPGSWTVGGIHNFSAAGTMSTTDAGAFVDGGSQVDFFAFRKAAATGVAGTPVSANISNTTAAVLAGVWIELVPDVQAILPSGITSEEALGTAIVSNPVAPVGIDPQEAFGTAIVLAPFPQTLVGQGIATAEIFGILTTRLYLSPSGIASGEVFGAHRVAALIGPVGILSGEQFGLANVAREQFLNPSAVVSVEAFGVPVLLVGYPQDVFPVGIESGELVEDPFVRNADRLVLVNPSIQETPVAWDRLNIRFGIHRGITIMQDELGVWRSLRYPAQTEMESAQRVYLGGRRHTITLDEANELTAAGYGAYITLEPDI